MRKTVADHRFQRWGVLVLGLFVVFNTVLSIYYHGRTYPDTTVAGRQLGGIRFADMDRRLPALKLLPSQLRLSGGQTAATLAVSGFGVQPDYDAVRQQAASQRAWLPMMNLIKAHDLALTLKLNDAAVQSAVKATAPAFDRQPADASIVRQGDRFTIHPDVPGQTLDAAATSDRVIDALRHGKSDVPVAVKLVQAPTPAAKLQKPVQDLNGSVATGITLHFDEKSKHFSQSDIAGWFVTDHNIAQLSESAVRQAVSIAGAGFGINVGNQTEAAGSIKQALQSRKQLSYGLQPQPAAAKTINYCTNVRGVSSTEIQPLTDKAKETFADDRGWNLNGTVSFQYDPAGQHCDFTIWLTAADQMSSFGDICDPQWSCAVPPNVVINYDRWRYTSGSWQSYGGTLEDYRAMAINHETGHWLGFAHSGCPGPGQPAPVMEQQSIDLQGCVFNPWPTATEQAALKTRLGL